MITRFAIPIKKGKTSYATLTMKKKLEQNKAQTCGMFSRPNL